MKLLLYFYKLTNTLHDILQTTESCQQIGGGMVSGSVLVSINKVALYRARLVLGWVTVCGWVNHLGM